MALAEARSPDFAFVDLHLRDGETGSEIAQRLAERGVAVVIATANPDEVDDREHVLGIVNKPYSPETIRAVLRYAVEKLADGDVDPAEPPGFRAPSPLPLRTGSRWRRFHPPIRSYRSREA